MELKVHFPSPYEDGTNVKQFLTLMRIALKATEKTYEEVIKGLTKEEEENIYLRFNNAFDNEEKAQELQESLDPDYNKTQDVWIEILST